MSALKYWLWLSLLKGIGNMTAGRLLRRFPGPKDIFFARESEYKECGVTSKEELAALNVKNLDSAMEVLERCGKLGIRIVTRQDAEYPARLQNIYDPPMLLYVAGTLPALDDEPAVGVVGTRKCTPYGSRVAEQLGYEITLCGGTVVTGLAEGVDSAAARGALRGGGRPIGVLGTGIDVVFPPFNISLQRDVAAAGALISEYPPGTFGSRANFPRRNRIISGVSLGVVIVEAPASSGALITAARAADQGREVFAVPGNIDSPACMGSNALLKENQAIPVTSGWDVMREYELRFPDRLKRPEKGKLRSLDKKMAEELGTQAAGSKKEVDKPTGGDYIDIKAQLEELTEDELSVVSVMTDRDMHLDDIIDRAEKPATKVIAALTALELKGYAVSGKGRRYTLVVSKDDKK